MGHVVVETGVSWARAQQASLLVVLGTSPTYNPNVDVRFARHAQFFANHEVTVSHRNWQTAPSGAVMAPQDVQRAVQAKVFDQYLEFPQTYRPSPRSVTDWTQGNADIFVGNDTYGWPPDPTPPYWSPQAPLGSVVLNTFPAYSPAGDIFLLRPSAKVFGEPEVYFKGQQPLGAIGYTYTTYTDFSWVKQQAKVFVEPEPYWRFERVPTANILNVLNVYNPAIDPIFLRPSAKVFGEFEPFWRGQGITQNVLIFLPRPYDFTGDFKFRRQDQTFPPYVEFPDNFTQKFSFEVVVNRLVPPPPPPPLPGQFVLPSFIGLTWYEASFNLTVLGLLQTQGPVPVQQGIYPTGTVVGQIPAAGVPVFPRTDITLVVESGANLLGASFDLNVNRFKY